MANINKIRVSGTTYDIQDSNAPKTVELTQAQYDALVTGGTVDPNTFYIITDATAGDLSNYYTKSETSGATEISTALASKADTATTYTKTEVDNAITAATSTKQDTLVSGTNIKTINNESILGSGNINIQGGGGSSYTAGDGIDITNDVISVTGKVDTTTFNTYSGSVDTALSGKQDTLSAGTGIDITDNVISATGGGGSITIDPSLDSGSTNPVANSAITNNTLSGGVESNNYFRSVRFRKNNGEVAFYKRFAAINGNSVMVDGTTEAPNFSLVEASAITTSVTSSSTDAQVPSAKAVNDKLGGLSIVKLTESEYAALVTKDSNTLYCVVPDPSN